MKGFRQEQYSHMGILKRLVWLVLRMDKPVKMRDKERRNKT